MAQAHDFKRAMTRAIEPTGGPGVELTTLEDAVRFIGHGVIGRQPLHR
jgi:hypothetical protein